MGILLLATVFLPLIGALMPLGGQRTARRWALGIALLTLAGTAILVFGYSAEGQESHVARLDWIGEPIDVHLELGLDGLSLWLFGLAALLMLTAVLVSWEAIRQQAAAYYRLLLILETGMLGVFAARDIILFYVFFEFTLIPLFLLIGIWGSEQRRYAAIKFFLYTLAGSVLTLLGLLAIVLWNRAQTGVLTFSIPDLTDSLRTYPLGVSAQVWIFLALFAGFAIKVPLFPLHTWLPLAHVEAPTAGSVILAGVLLKLGTYGFVRFCLPMLPDATVICMPYLLGLSVAGILYGALVALAQSDIKRLIAYSSISHLGFCMLGIFALNPLGVRGGVLQMVAHGLSTGGLFALVGMMYERYHTRKIAELGGLAAETPVLAFFMLVMVLSSVALPGLSGFAAEVLILLGMFQRAWADAPAGWVVAYRVFAVLALSGVILGAWYMLLLVERVFFGPLRRPRREAAEAPVRDLSLHEVMALAPLAVFILWIGVYPRFFIERMDPTLDTLTENAMDVANDPASRLRLRTATAKEQAIDPNFIIPPGPQSGGVGRSNVLTTFSSSSPD